MNWTEPTDEVRALWQEWLDERPADVRAVAERFNPWTMYRLTTTGQRCQVIGFHETDDGPTVYIYAEHETLGPMTGVNVFGINPDDVVPWEGDKRPGWVVERTPSSGATFEGFTAGDTITFRIEGDEP
jgi:hypothetical protein